MKKIFTVIVGLMLSVAANSQHLRISSIIGPTFPAFGDTIYEYEILSGVSVTVNNLDSIDDFNDTLKLFMSGNLNLPELIFFDSTTSMIPHLGSNTYTLHPFQFSDINFDDGDNIVVIWPAASSVLQVDTFNYDVYFISMAVAVNELETDPISICPNPATQYLFLGDLDKTKIKQVRIRDSLGKIIYEDSKVSPMINIESFRRGMYYIEIQYNSGRQRSLKFIKS